MNELYTGMRGDVHKEWGALGLRLPTQIQQWQASILTAVTRVLVAKRTRAVYLIDHHLKGGEGTTYFMLANGREDQPSEPDVLLLARLHKRPMRRQH